MADDWADFSDFKDSSNHSFEADFDEDFSNVVDQNTNTATTNFPETTTNNVTTPTETAAIQEEKVVEISNLNSPGLNSSQTPNDTSTEPSNKKEDSDISFTDFTTTNTETSFDFTEKPTETVLPSSSIETTDTNDIEFESFTSASPVVQHNNNNFSNPSTLIDDFDTFGVTANVAHNSNTEASNQQPAITSDPNFDIFGITTVTNNSKPPPQKQTSDDLFDVFMVPSPSVFRDAPQPSVAKQPTLSIYNEFDFLTAPYPSVFRDAPEPQKSNNINVDFDSFTSNDNSNHNTVSDKVAVDNDFVGFTGNAANTNEKEQKIDDNNTSNTKDVTVNEAEPIIQEQSIDNKNNTSNTTEVTVNETEQKIQEQPITIEPKKEETVEISEENSNQFLPLSHSSSEEQESLPKIDSQAISMDFDALAVPSPSVFREVTPNNNENSDFDFVDVPNSNTPSEFSMEISSINTPIMTDNMSVSSLATTNDLNFDFVVPITTTSSSSSLQSRDFEFFTENSVTAESSPIGSRTPEVHPTGSPRMTHEIKQMNFENEDNNTFGNFQEHSDEFEEKNDKIDISNNNNEKLDSPIDSQQETTSPTVVDSSTPFVPEENSTENSNVSSNEVNNENTDIGSTEFPQDSQVNLPKVESSNEQILLDSSTPFLNQENSQEIPNEISTTEFNNENEQITESFDFPKDSQDNSSTVEPAKEQVLIDSSAPSINEENFQENSNKNSQELSNQVSNEISPTEFNNEKEQVTESFDFPKDSQDSSSTIEPAKEQILIDSSAPFITQENSQEISENDFQKNSQDEEFTFASNTTNDNKNNNDTEFEEFSDFTATATFDADFESDFPSEFNAPTTTELANQEFSNEFSEEKQTTPVTSNSPVLSRNETDTAQHSTPQEISTEISNTNEDFDDFADFKDSENNNNDDFGFDDFQSAPVTSTIPEIPQTVEENKQEKEQEDFDDFGEFTESKNDFEFEADFDDFEGPTSTPEVPPTETKPETSVVTNNTANVTSGGPLPLFAKESDDILFESAKLLKSAFGAFSDNGDFTPNIVEILQSNSNSSGFSTCRKCGGIVTNICILCGTYVKEEVAGTIRKACVDLSEKLFKDSLGVQPLEDKQEEINMEEPGVLQPQVISPNETITAISNTSIKRTDSIERSATPPLQAENLTTPISLGANDLDFFASPVKPANPLSLSTGSNAGSKAVTSSGGGSVRDVFSKTLEDMGLSKIVTKSDSSEPVTPRSDITALFEHMKKTVNNDNGKEFSPSFVPAENLPEAVRISVDPVADMLSKIPDLSFMLSQTLVTRRAL